MSAYLETQLAVYRHLMARHERDPTFRFKVRQQSFPGNGLFVGKEFPAGAVKPYFSFTYWQITSGSQGDVLAYVVEAAKVGGFTVCLDLHPLPNGAEQDARNRELTTAVRAQIPGSWKRDAPYGQLHRPVAATTAALLTEIDALLDQTKKPLDKLVRRMREQYPAWEGEELSAAKFSSILANLGQWRSALLNGDFASVAREQNLKLLPKLWSSTLSAADWEPTRATGQLQFTPPPKVLSDVKAGDLLVAVFRADLGSMYGIGRLYLPDESVFIGFAGTCGRCCGLAGCSAMASSPSVCRQQKFC